MEKALKDILIGIATALSVASISVGINTYIDVQLLKNTQSEQSDTVKTTREILNRIDKTQAVQTETLRTLSDLINSLKSKEH